MRILSGASRRIFRFSPSRAFPRALNDVNKPKRLGSRLVRAQYELELLTCWLASGSLAASAIGNLNIATICFKVNFTKDFNKEFR
jgi:hypothetical protein